MGSTVKMNRIKSMKSSKNVGRFNSLRSMKMLKNIGSSEWFTKHQIDGKDQ